MAVRRCWFQGVDPFGSINVRAAACAPLAGAVSDAQTEGSKYHHASPNWQSSRFECVWGGSPSNPHATRRMLGLHRRRLASSGKGLPSATSCSAAFEDGLGLGLGGLRGGRLRAPRRARCYRARLRGSAHEGDSALLPLRRRRAPVVALLVLGVLVEGRGEERAQLLERRVVAWLGLGLGLGLG